MSAAAGLVANQIQGLGHEPYGMVALGSACSAAITVDARKRTTSERPGANANDARLMTRRRGSATQPGGSPTLAGVAQAGGCPIGERYGLPEASAVAVAHLAPGDGALSYHATAMAAAGMQLARQLGQKTALARNSPCGHPPLQRRTRLLGATSWARELSPRRSGPKRGCGRRSGPAQSRRGQRV